eukprot:Rhum_TRINITY_DN15374_c3_g1::Rhum_TRINITY_DN15374_c3_g1_i5::g.153800::m.153800
MRGVTTQLILLVVCFSLSFIGLASGQTCGPFRSQCTFVIGSGDFTWSQLASDYTFTKDNQRETCNRRNWAAFDSCRQTGCDLSLVITEPPELRMTICAKISTSSPSVTGTFGLELPVTSPPDPSGCDVRGWSPRPGSIAILNSSGGCRQRIKAQNMVDHNITLTAIFSISNENEERPWHWGTNPKETPGIIVGRDRSEYLLEHLAAGAQVKGRLQRNCQAPAADEGAYPELECPWVALRGLCATMPRQEDRLCSRCPAELRAPTLPRPVCVYGNELLPRVPKNTLTLPVQKPAADVVVMEVGACAEADFAGVSGKIVVVDLSTRAKCFPFGAVRAAEKAGALAVMARVWRSDAVYGTQDVYGELGFMLRGFSSVVNIPVHTISVADFELLHNASLGSALVGRLRRLSDDAAHMVSIAEGAFPPHPASDKVAVAEGSNFEWNSVTVPCVVIIVILFAVIMCAVAYKMRQGSTVLDTGAKGFSVPLAAWSLGLSLLLLAIVAAVAFVLADEAGRDATDTALADGKAAAQLTYRHAVVTAEELSREVQNGVVSATLTNIKTFLTQGENWLDTTMPLFSNFDGTWESFDSQQKPVMGQYVNQKVDERLLKRRPTSPTDRAGWKVRIFGENGFYLCPDYKTDDRSDTERGDGVVGNVSVTNDGNLYGFQKFFLSNGFLLSFKDYTKTFLNISHQIGGTRGDPLSMVPDAGLSYWSAQKLRRYHVTKRSFPGVEQLLAQPISIFKILYDDKRNKRGIIEAAVSLELFGRMLHWLNVEYKSMENLTALVYDKADESLIATNVWHNVKTYGMIYYTQSGITGYRGGSSYDARSLYTLYDVPIVQINALGNYMKSPEWLSSNVSGAFDQASHFSTFWITLFKIEAEAGGAVRDTLETGHRAEVRGCGRGTCVAHDAARGHPVVHLDGAAALFVYHNLTTDAELVRTTRVSGPDSPWQSSAPEFSNVMTLSDGTECVTYNDEVVAGVPSPKCMAISTPFNIGVHTIDKKSGDFSISVRVNPDEAIGSDQWDDMPALFTDQPSRASAFERRTNLESGITLYANGQFVMMGEHAVNGACITQPLPGGLPRGVWTTITATAETSFFSRSTRMRAEPADCRVYINGTLWSSMKLVHFEMSAEAHLRPYVFGAGLRGRLDDVMLFNKSLTAKEAASVHRDGQVTPDVPPKEWLVSAGAHELSSSSITGIDWTVVAMVPRDDVMREVDANAQRTLHDLEVQDEETRRKLTRKRGEAALVLIVLGLCAALAFMLFNHMLTEPIKEVATVIHKAAFLLVDDIPPTHSFIQEVNVIMQSVSVMFANVKEYKSYLPMHVRAVAAHALETESESETSDGGSVRTEGSQTSRSSKKSKSATDSGRGSGKVSHAAFVLAAPVVKKKVSLTLTNLQGYDARTKESPALCKSVHRAALEVFLPLFSKHRGMPESFTGDKFVCTFNASKPAADHRLAAARVALALQEASCDLARVNTALTTGNCRVGPLGTEEMMKLSVIGPIMQWVFVLERIGRVSGLATVTDGAMREQLSLFTCCTRTYVRYPQLGSEMIEVCAVLGENQVTTEEWMYQLAQAGNAFGPWNQFCSFVAHGRWSEAEDLAEEALTPALEHCSEVYAMFRDALHRKCPLNEAKEGLMVTRDGSKQRLQPMLEAFTEFSSTHVHLAS